jgi:hypothetical protein
MSLASPHTRRPEARKCCFSVVAKANCPAPGVTDASEHVRVVVPLLLSLLLTLSDYGYNVHVA